MFQVFNVYKSMVMSDLSSWIYIDPVISLLSELPDVNCTPCSLWWPVLKACFLAKCGRRCVCCTACWVYSSWPSLAERDYSKSERPP